jgi:hypothetical protein
MYCLGPASGDCSGSPKTTLKKSISADGGLTFVNFTNLTSPDLVIINSLAFYVRGSLANDNTQPSVIIILQGVSGAQKTQSRLNIQTTISQRFLDS